MKVKQKLSMGLKKRKPTSRKKKCREVALTFSSIVRKGKNVVKGLKEEDIRKDSFLRKKVQDVLKVIDALTGVQKMSQTRIIPIPKTGGMLPLIPIVTGISKIGAIAGGVSSIVNAIRDIINLRKTLRNGQQQQVGNGLFLTSYRKGYGLYLSPPYPKNCVWLNKKFLTLCMLFVWKQ